MSTPAPPPSAPTPDEPSPAGDERAPEPAAGGPGVVAGSGYPPGYPHPGWFGGHPGGTDYPPPGYPPPGYPPPYPPYPFAPRPREPWLNPAKRGTAGLLAVLAAVVLLGGGILIGVAIGGTGHHQRSAPSRFEPFGAPGRQNGRQNQPGFGNGRPNRRGQLPARPRPATPTPTPSSS